MTFSSSSLFTCWTFPALTTRRDARDASRVLRAGANVATTPRLEPAATETERSRAVDAETRADAIACMATAREVGWFLAAAAAFELDADEFASSSERVRCWRADADDVWGRSRTHVLSLFLVLFPRARAVTISSS